MSDHEKPLVLRLLWGGGDIRHNFSLQENETGDIVVSGKGLLCKLHCWEPVRSTNAVDKYFIFFFIFFYNFLTAKIAVLSYLASRIQFTCRCNSTFLPFTVFCVHNHGKPQYTETRVGEKQKLASKEKYPTL